MPCRRVPSPGGAAIPSARRTLIPSLHPPPGSLHPSACRMKILRLLGSLTLLLLAASAALATPDPDEHFLAPLVDNPDAEVIPGQYIVVFRPDVSLANARVFADSLNIGRFIHIGREFKAVAGPLSPEMLHQVRARSDLVDYVHVDQIARIQALAQYNPDWGLDRVDQRKLPLDDYYIYAMHEGANAHVYIIDTGINHDHVNFRGNAWSGYNFHDNMHLAEDDNGHGTHVAGTVGSSTWGVAKSASLISVRVLGANGSGSMSNVVAGVAWAAEHHRNSLLKKSVAIISLTTSANQPLDDAVLAAIHAGLTVVAAAGNEGRDACHFSPGRVSAVITVAASDINDVRAGFSNYGPCVDIFAPGVSITSTWIGSYTATRTLSGTSIAAPHVAGIAALRLIQNRSIDSPTALKEDIIRESTKDIITDTRGSPNRLAYIYYR
ncbi:hypothetical protein H696_01814 [Fonticula alba]|uniref:Peptidase S8/S53 domain-containing protein n=1 Tax=Fonticula alba TaxID=691883 RepID=A0A058Z9S7_FONAL|nr:hypothetical protein H696_01814 [Fonticula alba]KCV70871.1 hypothetical protein H696_01814 [Fonticula alba]|eukprot:XP_009493994.1 hypothetical protein H696_01814 [Fonticula alba]